MRLRFLTIRHTALSEKAVHWRVERILQRLQKAANDLGIKSASLSLAVSSKNPQKRKKYLPDDGELYFGESERVFAH
jgi:hypothetical protein